MIRPVNFTFNEQTAVNNAFQVAGKTSGVQQQALKEFDELVNKLQSKGIDVTIVNDTPEPHTPDSIFPNNWISFHQENTVILYPMYAENRRLERKPSVLNELRKKFTIKKTIDLSTYEDQQKYLEGTGSLVLDRDKKIAYACLSPRTDKQLLEKFCEEMSYRPVAFHGVDQNGRAIYHTNVMMCVGDDFVVICLASISNVSERSLVEETINSSGKKLVEITFGQMNNFAGNMLQVNNREGKKFLVMSSRAYASLSKEQLQLLEAGNEIIHSSLNTIETNGGGSARCMIAEVFY
jgi:hypothetical protein